MEYLKMKGLSCSLGKKKVIGLFLGVVIVVSVAASAWGERISVPEDYLTIQAAIDSATEGDEIVVSPGTYSENIQFKGKNVVLRSTDPSDPSVVARTILDGGQQGSVVKFAGSEDNSCVLSGFTITNGLASNGGGIAGAGSSPEPTITNNVIQGNRATSYGGGVYWCYGVFENNTVRQNTATSYGGGLYRCYGIVRGNTIEYNVAEVQQGGGMAYCGDIVEKNLIRYNTASKSGGGIAQTTADLLSNIITHNTAGESGGGVHACGNPADINDRIEGNTITHNSAKNGGGVSYNRAVMSRNLIAFNQASISGGGVFRCEEGIRANLIYGNSAEETGGGIYDCPKEITNNTIYGNTAGTADGGIAKNVLNPGIITNCIIWGNNAPTEGQIPSGSNATYSCIQGWSEGGVGNISDDPKFRAPSAWDLRLEIESPCIDAGRYNAYSKVDFDGNRRPIVGYAQPRGDGSDIDMGAIEFDPNPDEPYFDLQALDPYQVVTPSEQAEFHFAIVPRNGFNGPVDFSVVSGNGSYSFSPASLTPPGTTTLALVPSGTVGEVTSLNVMASSPVGDVTKETTVSYQIAEVSGRTSMIFLRPVRESIPLGDSTSVRGRLLPPSSGETVDLEIAHGGGVEGATVETQADGTFAFDFVPTDVDDYSIGAGWAGTTKLDPAQSESAWVTVEPRLSTISVQLDLPEYPIITDSLKYSVKVHPAPTSPTAEAQLLVWYVSDAANPLRKTYGIPLQDGQGEGSFMLLDDTQVRVKAVWPGEEGELQGAKSPYSIFTVHYRARTIAETESEGASVIIAGGASSNLPEEIRDYLSNFSYSVFSGRRFQGDRLQYINRNSAQDVDWDGVNDNVVTVTDASLQGIGQAFDKVAVSLGTTGSVSVFVIGESGAGNTLTLADGSLLSASDLDSVLVQKLGADRQIQILVEASNSGTFCQNLVSANRTVICSALTENAAYFSNGLLSFSQLYLTQAQAGWCVQECFEYAQDYIRAALGFFGAQTPAIFVGPSAEPSETFHGISSDAADASPPEIESIFEPLVIEGVKGQVVSVRVTDDGDVDSVAATLRRADGVETSVPLTRNQEDSAQYDLVLDSNALIGIGLYNVSVVASDAQRNCSQPKDSQILVIGPQGDLNGDTDVDEKDLYILFESISATTSGYDVHADGILDYLDLFTMALKWQR